MKFEQGTGDRTSVLIRRHLVAGWLGLVVFLSLGIALEVFHGLKLDFYLDLRNGPRRMLWTLAHTHGTLFALLSLAFAWTNTQCPASIWLSRASTPLLASLVLMPTGFFLGGISLHGGDPNLWVLLVPVGAALVLVAVVFTLLGVLFPSGAVADVSSGKPRRAKKR